MRVKVQFVVQVNPTTSDWTKWVVKAWILSSEQTLVWLLRAGAGRLNTINPWRILEKCIRYRT